MPHPATLRVSPVRGHRWPGPHAQVLPAQWWPAVSLPPNGAQFGRTQGQALRIARCHPPPPASLTFLAHTLPSPWTLPLDSPSPLGLLVLRTPALMALETVEAAGQPGPVTSLPVVSVLIVSEEIWRDRTSAPGTTSPCGSF